MLRDGRVFAGQRREGRERRPQRLARIDCAQRVFTDEGKPAPLERGIHAHLMELRSVGRGQAEPAQPAGAAARQRERQPRRRAIPLIVIERVVEAEIQRRVCTAIDVAFAGPVGARRAVHQRMPDGPRDKRRVAVELGRIVRDRASERDVFAVGRGVHDVDEILEALVERLAPDAHAQPRPQAVDRVEQRPIHEMLGEVVVERVARGREVEDAELHLECVGEAVIQPGVVEPRVIRAARVGPDLQVIRKIWRVGVAAHPETDAVEIEARAIVARGARHEVAVAALRSVVREAELHRPVEFHRELVIRALDVEAAVVAGRRGGRHQAVAEFLLLEHFADLIAERLRARRVDVLCLRFGEANPHPRQFALLCVEQRLQALDALRVAGGRLRGGNGRDRQRGDKPEQEGRTTIHRHGLTPRAGCAKKKA